MTSIDTAGAISVNPDDYHAFVVATQHTLAERAARSPLLTVEAAGLYETFVQGLDERLRASQNCGICRGFVSRYGGAVVVGERGRLISALWDETVVPAPFDTGVAALRRRVERSSVIGALVSGEPDWGRAAGGGFEHLHAPSPAVFSHPLQTAAQRSAEIAEDRAALGRAVDRYHRQAAADAVRLLGSGSLTRPEKVLGPAEWFLSVHDRLAGVAGPGPRDAELWAAASSAPAGFCHVSSSMLGVLLADLSAGVDFQTVSRRFAALLNPAQYQRPSAAPSAGNVAEAERIVARLQAAGSLARRYARLDDLQLLWSPTAPEQRPGVFGGVLTRADRRPRGVVPPPVPITWEKFERTVLPTALAMRYQVPAGNQPYGALLTAVDPRAEPILQWDNPVSWYVYVNGSAPGAWGLSAGGQCRVTGICLQPTMWSDRQGYPHQGQAVFLLLEGARDTRKASLGLFPEILRAELRPVRATIEAYSGQHSPAGADNADACGLRLGAGQNWTCRVEVDTADGTLAYLLDRWD